MSPGFVMGGEYSRTPGLSRTLYLSVSGYAGEKLMCEKLSVVSVRGANLRDIASKHDLLLVPRVGQKEVEPEKGETVKKKNPTYGIYLCKLYNPT